MEATATCSISAAPKALADHLAAVKPAVGTRSAISTLTGVRISLSNAVPAVAFIEATDMEVAVRRDILRDLHSCTVGGELDVIVSHADLTKAVKLFAKRESVSLVAAPRTVRAFDSESTIATELRRRGTTVIYPIIEHGYGAGTVKPGARGSSRDVLAYIAEVETVMALPPETVDDLRVTDGKRTIELHSLDAANWPKFPAGDEAHLLTVDGPEFAAVLERAGRFASKDDTRPVLTGIAIHYGNGMRVQATDSYRLADLAVTGMRSARSPEQDSDVALVNSPARALLMAAKGMRKTEAVTVSTTDTHTFVRYDGGTWAMRRITGNYPNFRQLVPDDHEVTVTMPADELAGACDVAVAFARKNAPMALSVNGVVKVTGSTPDVCEFEELLESASYQLSDRPMQPWPGELTIGLNPAFVADIAKAYAASDVTVKLISPLRPALFVDGEDLYLLMPIRLNV